MTIETAACYYCDECKGPMYPHDRIAIVPTDLTRPGHSGVRHLDQDACESSATLIAEKDEQFLRELGIKV